MMYRHKQYGIIWKMIDKRHCTLVNPGTKFTRGEIGKTIKLDKSDMIWHIDEWLIIEEFNEYIKLLNK